MARRISETDQIPARELRDHVSEVLRRVEAGETLEVTVDDRPVALLVPRSGRPATLPTNELLSSVAQADEALRIELAAELGETTDDLADPWQQ